MGASKFCRIASINTKQLADDQARPTFPKPSAEYPSVWSPSVWIWGVGWSAPLMSHLGHVRHATDLELLMYPTPILSALGDLRLPYKGFQYFAACDLDTKNFVKLIHRKSSFTQNHWHPSELCPSHAGIFVVICGASYCHQLPSKKRQMILLMFLKSRGCTSWGNGSWNPIIYGQGFSTIPGGCFGISEPSANPTTFTTPTKSGVSLNYHPFFRGVLVGVRGEWRDSYGSSRSWQKSNQLQQLNRFITTIFCVFFHDLINQLQMRCAISPYLCGVGRFDFAKKQHPFSHEIFELFDGGGGSKPNHESFTRVSTLNQWLKIAQWTKSHGKHTPLKFNMEPGNDGFSIEISFSKGPFSGSMFVMGGVCVTMHPDKTFGRKWMDQRWSDQWVINVITLIYPLYKWVITRLLISWDIPSTFF